MLSGDVSGLYSNKVAGDVQLPDVDCPLAIDVGWDVDDLEDEDEESDGWEVASELPSDVEELASSNKARISTFPLNFACLGTITLHILSTQKRSSRVCLWGCDSVADSSQSLQQDSLP